MQLKTRPRPLARDLRATAGPLSAAIALLALLTLAPLASRRAPSPPAAAPTVLPRLSLRIDEEGVRRLRELRRRALAARNLLGAEDERVAATIAAGGAPAAIRLGLSPRPEDLPRAPGVLRVDVAEGHDVLGLAAFDLVPPTHRDLGLEWLGRELLRREGLLAPRLVLVELEVNGQPMGLHAVDELLDHRALAAQGRRAGPLLRLVQERPWAEASALAMPDLSPDDWVVTGDGSGAAEDVRRAFEDLRRGAVAAGDVLAPSFATWLVLVDLLGTRRRLGPWSVRLHADPETGRAEPAQERVAHASGTPSFPDLAVGDSLITGRFLARVFEDRRLGDRYVAELERLVAPGALERVLGELAPQLEGHLAALRAGNPSHPDPTALLLERRAGLRSRLEPFAGVVAHVEAAGEGADGASVLRLQVAAAKSLPVVVDEVTDPCGNRWRPLVAPAYLPAKPPFEPLRFVELTLVAPRGALAPELDSLQLRYRLSGASASRTTPVLARPAWRDVPAADDVLRVRDTLADAPFVTIDAARGVARIAPGEWRVERPLLVPAGLVLEAGPGTRLDLVSHAFVLSRSPVRLVGAAGAPVVITSSDGTGQGLVVLAAGASVLEEVELSRLGAPARGAWAAPAAVTFHRARVTVRRTRLAAMRAPIALDLVGCTFDLEGVRVEHATDGLALHFGRGTLSDCAFARTAGHAVDCSGAQVELTRVAVEDAGGTALRARDGARVRARELTVRGAAVGVTSEDGSSVALAGGELAGCRLGLRAFHSPPHLGPATLEVQGLALRDVAQPYLVERGSRLVRDGQVETGSDAERLEGWR